MITMLSGVHIASSKHGDLLLHLMLSIYYYWCSDSEHQVPRVLRLVTGYISQNGTC